MAACLKDRAVDIARQSRRKYTFKKGDRVGFVFPVHTRATPEIVIDFARALDLSKAFSYAVCTCADAAGHAMTELSRQVLLYSAYSVIMPNNNIIGAKGVDDNSTALHKMQLARERIATIARGVAAKHLEFDVRVGGSALRRAQELPASADPAALGTAAFHIRPEACSGCGACRKHCPVQAIALVAGTPTWIRPACQMCLRCINSCPGMAIEYGDLTQGRARYVFQPP